VKHVLYIVFMILVATFFWVLMNFFEAYKLENNVIPFAGLRLSTWLENFRSLAFLGIVICGFLSILWYLLGQWAFKFNYWNKKFRAIWCLFLVLTIIVTAILCFLTINLQEGTILVYIFYFINNFFTFYLGTLLFSPASVKYTPLGAEYVRHW